MRHMRVSTDIGATYNVVRQKTMISRPESESKVVSKAGHN